MYHLITAIILFIFSPYLLANSDLSHCAELFIADDVNNSPTLYSSLPTEPYRDNRHHCYRTEHHAFFVLEYWPKHHTPRWVAYKIDDQYGTDGCATRPRREMQCYFKNQSWEQVEECVDAFRTTGAGRASDPFHEDVFLMEGGEERLNIRAFSSTGHDRGHMAPNDAFSWDLCAAYHTFTMANMSPQRASLNRGQWAALESQVLYWGAEHGPIYVVTGPIFNKFPASRFQGYKSHDMDESQIYAKNTPLPSFSSSPDPTNPDVIVPTGYYKVIYRPAIEEESAQAIGFLMPHTTERISDFWDFVSRIDLIEEASGVRFPSIPDTMKKQWASDYFFDRERCGWRLRNNCEFNYTASGWLEDSTHEERMRYCTLN